MDFNEIRGDEWAKLNPPPSSLGDSCALFDGFTEGEWKPTFLYACERPDHEHSQDARLQDPFNPDGTFTYTPHPDQAKITASVTRKAESRTSIFRRLRRG